MADAARAMVRERYGWRDVAEATARVYAAVADEAEAARTSGTSGPALTTERMPIAIPEGNLLESAGLLP
jgi:glycogen synthase